MNPDIEKFVRHPLNGKIPILPEWQKLTKTPDNMQEYISKGYNQGAVCGKASGFTAIDLDHELFVDDIFNGFELNTLKSARTQGRGHIYFKYNPSLPASKHHDLGIEILSDGSNVVIPPSKHPSGDVYKWIDPDAPIIEMPEKLIGNWEKLRTTEAELKQFIAKCRHCFRDVLKKHPDMHGAEGREYMLAVCTDLKAAGAIESHVRMFAKLMYGKEFDEARTLQEWRNIDASKTWRCETIKAKLPSYIDFNECDKCDKRRDNYKGNANTPIQDYHWTDLGNAQRIKDKYGDSLRFCHPMKNWFVWDEKRWNIDREAFLERLARRTVQDIYNEALSMETETEEQLKRKREKIGFALSCESAARIRNMIELAKSESGIPVIPEILDKDTMMFNVQNGTIDLRTGQLKPHIKEDFITKISPVNYDKEAQCPIWISFLNKIFDNNKNIIEYMQRKAGYCMTGETLEEDFDEYYGTGGNGKSKYVNELFYIMGEYGAKINVETIQAASDRTNGNAASSDVARLKGIRYVVVSEPSKGTQLNEQRIKDWTGREKITARHLYQEPITYTPEFKIICVTNYKLRIRGTDNGIWRRVKLVPFDVTIPEDEQDKQLDKKLIKESSGILNWMIEGCLKWQKDGLKVPIEILEATDEYRKDQDYLGEFFKNCCDVGKGHKSIFNSIFLTYRAYCKIYEMPVQGKMGFSDTLESKKFKKVHEMKGSFYTGISLKPEISKKYDEIISQSGGREYDDMTTMTTFLESFLDQFSCRDFSEKSSRSSWSSYTNEADSETPKEQPTASETPQFQDFGQRAKDWEMMNSKSITNETKIQASMDIAQSLKKLNVNPSDVLRYLEKAYGLTPEATP